MTIPVLTMLCVPPLEGYKSCASWEGGKLGWCLGRASDLYPSLDVSGDLLILGLEFKKKMRVGLIVLFIYFLYESDGCSQSFRLE